MTDLCYRELTIDDKPYMKGVCLQCFPIEYPDSWYDDLLTGDNWTYTQGAFELSTGQMVGMIVGQVQTLHHLESEYGYVVKEGSGSSDLIMYITIFGVIEEYRCKGVGSNLMHSLVQYADSCTTCKLVYLHVEDGNNVAINFYKKRNFKFFCLHNDYYTLEGEPNDGLVYIQYFDGVLPYEPGFENWCRRNTWSRPFHQCLTGAFKKPFNPFKRWQRSISLP
jgi:ribosomal protein S18 acetylase RimI-like enzyme